VAVCRPLEFRTKGVGRILIWGRDPLLLRCLCVGRVGKGIRCCCAASASGVLRWLLTQALEPYGSAEAAPIDTTKYATVLDSNGLSGACRGNGGSNDKVDAKSKGSTTQTQCESECDNMDACVGYAYSAGPRIPLPLALSVPSFDAFSSRKSGP